VNGNREEGGEILMGRKRVHSEWVSRDLVINPYVTCISFMTLRHALDGLPLPSSLPIFI
jgi:hypothetical protein